MQVTQRFQKSVILLFWLSLGYIVLNLAGRHYNLTGYSIDEPNSDGRYLSAFVFMCLSAAVLWVGIAFYTKAIIAAIISASLVFAKYGLHIWLVRAYGWENITDHLPYYTELLIEYCAFALFGLLYFKNGKGLLLGFVSTLSWPVFAEYPLHQLVLGLERLADLVHINSLSTLIITNRSTFYLLLAPFLNVIAFLLFWLVFDLLKYRKTDLRLLRIHVQNTLSRSCFSIVFWSLNLLYLAIIYKGTQLGKELFQTEVNIGTLLYTLLMLIAFYMLASLYRNFMVLFIIQNNKYPSWLYWLANLPLVNLLVWILLTKQSTVSYTPEEYENRSNILKDRFIKSNRNLKILLVSLLFLISMRLTIPYKNFYRTDEIEILLLIVSLLLITGLGYLYFKNPQAIFWLVSIKFILILITLVIKPHLLLPIVSIGGIYSLAYHYALFHFDKFKIEVKPVEELQPA